MIEIFFYSSSLWHPSYAHFSQSHIFPVCVCVFIQVYVTRRFEPLFTVWYSLIKCSQVWHSIIIVIIIIATRYFIHIYRSICLASLCVTRTSAIRTFHITYTHTHTDKRDLSSLSDILYIFYFIWFHFWMTNV